MNDVNGQLPFEGDTFIPQEIMKLRDKFDIEAVLECGSQYGATLQWLTDNFKHAEGCEPNPEFYEMVRAKGLAVGKIDSIGAIGYFAIGLRAVQKMFYIDSHWHDTPCPLKDELTLIGHITKNPVIVIHDFKVPDHPELGYDTYDFELCFEETEPYLGAIYPEGYDYHYNEQADGAMRGCIFLYPKTT